MIQVLRIAHPCRGLKELGPSPIPDASPTPGAEAKKKATKKTGTLAPSGSVMACSPTTSGGSETASALLGDLHRFSSLSCPITLANRWTGESHSGTQRTRLLQQKAFACWWLRCSLISTSSPRVVRRSHSGLTVGASYSRTQDCILPASLAFTR